MKLKLYIPKIDEYSYEEKIESDPLTMNYNAGYNVSYYGYHYDTGCIDFPKEKWKESYDKRIKEKKFFAYIKDIDLNEFIGYVNYQYNKLDDRFYCGILIENKYRGKGFSKVALKLLMKSAKSNGIKELYDNFETDRKYPLKLFESVGFVIEEKQKWKKFKTTVDGVLVKATL